MSPVLKLVDPPNQSGGTPSRYLTSTSPVLSDDADPQASPLPSAVCTVIVASSITIQCHHEPPHEATTKEDVLT